MKRLLSLLVVCLGPWVLSNATADLRVLFRFDASGFQVHRVVSTAKPGTAPAVAGTVLPSRPGAAAAVLTWRDATGAIILVTTLPDPRLSRSPGHNNGTYPSLLGLEQGAWVASGPEHATSVDIELPENLALALGPVTGSFVLEKEN